MATLNKVQLIGNLGRDPETRYTPNGTPVCTVSLATTNAWTDKQSGDRVEESEWHRVVFFGRLAEIVSEYMKKGRLALRRRSPTHPQVAGQGRSGTSTRPRSSRARCRCSARSRTTARQGAGADTGRDREAPHAHLGPMTTFRSNPGRGAARHPGSLSRALQRRLPIPTNGRSHRAA